MSHRRHSAGVVMRKKRTAAHSGRHAERLMARQHEGVTSVHLVHDGDQYAVKRVPADGPLTTFEQVPINVFAGITLPNVTYDTAAAS